MPEQVVMVHSKRAGSKRVTRAEALDEESSAKLTARLAELERAREAAERSSHDAYVGAALQG